LAILILDHLPFAGCRLNGADFMTMEARLNFRHPLGVTSVVVIVITFILFTTALFVKGFTQDLLLEAGVFLVSVKLILMSYKNAVTVESVEKKLDQILIEEENLKRIFEGSKDT
jgi:hypothetical protein